MSSLRKYFRRNEETGRYGPLDKKAKRFPTHTHTGEPLGFFGRLTYGWLWTNDQEIARMHEEQDRREGR